MNLFTKAFNKLFTKSNSANPSASLAVLQEFSQLLRISGNYQALAQTGYIENCVANTCIRRTCEAMNTIPLTYKVNGQEVESGKGDRLIRALIDVIENPSMDLNRKLWLETVQSQLFIDGNSYIFPREGSTSLVPVTELMPLRSDRMTIKEDTESRVFSYTYQAGACRYVFERDRWQDKTGEWKPNENGLQGRFNTVVLRTYNPSSDLKGLSRLGSCALSVQGHNNSLSWNNSVMENAGKSSGILSFGDNEAGSLDPEQIKVISDKLKLQTTGKNRGSILVSNSPAKFEKFNMTSQEMDFIEGTVQRSIEICNALDYPPYLLGLNGATFNNQAEAKLSLYENSAIPKVEAIYESISQFFSLKYKIDFQVCPDVSRVEAMAPRYAEKNDNIIKQYTSNVIRLNEAREKLGYEEDSANGDLFFSDFVRSNDNSPA
jgi:HK97 family phage portal protein